MKFAKKNTDKVSRIFTTIESKIKLHLEIIAI